MRKIIFAMLVFATIQNMFSQTISDCSTCSDAVLNESQLKGKSLEELAMLRNEISARKGYVFSTWKYAQYFGNQAWYKPVQSNSEIQLSEIENKNIEIIKKLEATEKTKRENSIKDLKELKSALNANNKVIINKYLSELPKELDSYNSIIRALKETLNKIDLDNIHWDKKSGLYKVSIDNGYSISRYEILFEYETVKIESGVYSHSEIIEDSGDNYSGYTEAGESQIWFVFKITENGIVYDHWENAG